MANHGTAQNPALPQFARSGSHCDRRQGISVRRRFDHPHEVLDMGGDDEIVCPYCSTLYVYDAKLPAGAADPESAVFHIEHA